jgi:hypothetical protein
MTMSAIAKYNPLKNISMPGAEVVDPKGIVVVVGPNSSGKTHFLRDIEHFLLTGMQRSIVCTRIDAQKPTYHQDFINELVEANYIRPIRQAKDQYQTYVPFMTPKRTDQSHQRHHFTLDMLQKAYDNFGDKNQDWFKYLGVTLVASLSLDERRSICDHVPSFNYQTHTPERPLQGLFVNSAAKDRLAAETGNVFGNAVWLDISETNILRLRVSESKLLPSHGEMTNPLQACNYTTLENEGDGYRSYVGMCLALLLATRPVSLIDEPELCLHPPQAYHMGRFIGQHAVENHVTFVATHSSHILRGLLETGRHVTVIRLSRINRAFVGKQIAEQELVNSVRNPRTRAESILDGIFSKGVVLVESEGDREEYQAAAEAIPDFAAREVQFVPVGGTGGFAEPLRFYRMLNIPIAVIADFDALCDTDKVTAIGNALCTDSSKFSEIIDKLQAMVQQIKALPPSITEADVRDRLRQLSEQSLGWNRGDDNRLRKDLNALGGELKRLRRLKEGGIAAYAANFELYAHCRMSSDHSLISAYSSFLSVNSKTGLKA